MGYAHLEDAVGVVDGANLIFNTSFAYTPGSLSVFINGQLKRGQDDDGWTELGGTTFSLKEAPLGDPPEGGAEKVRVFYIDTVTVPGGIIEEITGILDDGQDEIAGILEDIVEIQATLDDVDKLTGIIVEVDEMTALLEEVDPVTATVSECL